MLSTALFACASLAMADEAQLLRRAQEHLAAARLDEAAATLLEVPADARGFEWRHLDLALFCARSSQVSAPLSATTRWGCSGTVLALDHSPDGRLLAAGYDDGRALLLDAKGGEAISVCATHKSPVRSLCFAPGGEMLAVGHEDGTLRLHALDGTRLAECQGGERAQLALATRGARLASLSLDGLLRVHDMDDARLVVALRGFAAAPLSMAWLSDDELAVGEEGGRVRAWRVADGDPGREWPALQGKAQALLVMGERLWAAGDLAPLSSAALDATGEWRATAGPRKAVVALAAAPDGARLAAGLLDGRVWLVDAATAQPVMSLAPVDGALHALDFDASGARLAIAAGPGAIHVVETTIVGARRAQRDPLPPLPDLAAARALRGHELEKLLLAHLARDNRTKAHWLRVQELADDGMARFPTSGRMATAAGAARLRAGDPQAGLELLAQAKELDRGQAPTLAFHALALARCDKGDEAREAWKRLLVVLKEERWRDDVDMQSLRDEVESSLPPPEKKARPARKPADLGGR
ncbi:MAG: hypothetical protein RL112_314 [Planctomycetota bacterium]